MFRTAGIIAIAVFLVLAASTAAHDGQNHAEESNTIPVWLGAVGIVVVAALVIGVARRSDPTVNTQAGEYEDPEDVFR